MHYLNVDLKIIHRDLKAENIFLNKENDEIKAYIGDFGLSIHIESENDDNYRRAFNLGTLRWMVYYRKPILL